ncbi:MAG: hypothetical protein JRN45_00650 [Nitrososphaerota archaeon]|nr:hypothetical protein [Nitrososphaerota archaeon]
MRIERFRVRYTALSPISHGDQHYGNRTMSKREKVIQPDGRIAEVPVVSGNAIRGQLRRLSKQHLEAALGITEKDLPMCIAHLLLHGGLQTEGEEAVYDTGFECTLREALPSVDIFGGSVQNQILHGRMNLGFVWPVCTETAHIIGVRSTKPAEDTIIRLRSDELLSDEQATRRDDRQQKEPDKKGGTDSGQMIYNTEVIATGTELIQEITLKGMNEVGKACLWRALKELEAYGYIGGKNNAGLGRVRIEYLDIDPAAMDPSPYDAYIAQNKEKILKTFTAIGQRVEEAKQKAEKQKRKRAGGQAGEERPAGGPTGATTAAVESEG